MNVSKQAKKPNLPQSKVWEAWEDQAKALLVSYMTKNALGYKELSRRLEALGIYENPDQLNRKVNRKRFSAAFLLVCLEALKDDVTAVTESE